MNRFSSNESISVNGITTQSRRLFMFGGIVCMTSLSKASANAQDLLPPNMVVKKQKTNADELLDPNQIANSQTNRENTLTSSNSNYSPDYARSMQGEVVGAISTLLHAYEGTCNRCNGLNSDCKSLSSSLNKAKSDKQIKLDEYRGGFFCSGCGQTKSEILAKGETFPHPGQTAIPATAQQIAQKEAQLDAEIDRLLRQYNSKASERDTSENQYDEIRSQIELGIDLWFASTAFEIQSIYQSAWEIYSNADKQRAEALAQIEEIKKQTAPHPSRAQLEQIISSLNMWSQISSESAQKTNSAIKNRNAAIIAANQYAIENRSSLNKIASAMVSNIIDDGRKLFGETYRQRIINFDPDNFSANILRRGILFRMGDYSPSRKGQTLPKVQKFTDRMNNIRNTFPNPKSFPTLNQEQEGLNNWIKSKTDAAV